MSFNINKPTINKNAPEQVQIAQIIDYLERLCNDLNYGINHLDETNFSLKEMKPDAEKKSI